MRVKIISYLMLCRTLTACFLIICLPLFAHATTYYGYDDFGGTWYDTEKSHANSQHDGNMCWAGSAANVLAWTGWGAAVSNDPDVLFQVFRDHFTNQGGLQIFAWEWWFDGTNYMQGNTDWAQEDVDGGGGYYLTENFWRYYYEEIDLAHTMKSIDSYLHAGFGVGAALRGVGNHAITLWGYDYTVLTGGQIQYDGVWVTDSDDNKNTVNPPNTLKYYDVDYRYDDSLSGSAYFLEGQTPYGNGGWYIGEVYALDQNPVPEPATLTLLSLGLIVTAGLIRRKQ